MPDPSEPVAKQKPALWPAVPCHDFLIAYYGVVAASLTSSSTRASTCAGSSDSADITALRITINSDALSLDARIHTAPFIPMATSKQKCLKSEAANETTNGKISSGQRCLLAESE